MRRDDTLTAKVFFICLIIILGFVVWMIVNNFSDDKEVDFDAEGFHETVSIEGLALVPGDERDYSFKLKCRDKGEYQVGLRMVEKPEGDGGLKEFINVKIVLDDKVLYEGSLKEVLLGEAVIYGEPVSFSRESVDLVITYAMPIEVGNEAMGTFADFDMTLMVSEKGAPLNV